jgi:hypothetical protein
MPRRHVRRALRRAAECNPIAGRRAHSGTSLCRAIASRPRSTLPTIVIAGGEPTITLEAAIVLHEARERGGTDGRDGPTDAAGAIVDAATVRRIAQTGRNAKQELAHHRSYRVLGAAGQLMRTGPTGTNVADLVLGYLPAAGAGWQQTRGRSPKGPARHCQRRYDLRATTTRNYAHHQQPRRHQCIRAWLRNHDGWSTETTQLE